MVKSLPAVAEEPRSIPGSGRFPGEGNGNPLSCLENSMDRGVWWAAGHEVAKIQTQLSDSSSSSTGNLRPRGGPAVRSVW